MLSDAEYFVPEKVHIHNAENPPLLVHHREGEKLVHDKHFTRVQHRRCAGDCDDLVNHYVRKTPVERRGEQAASRQNPEEAVMVVHDIEVYDLLADSLLADEVQRLLNR